MRGPDLGAIFSNEPIEIYALWNFYLPGRQTQHNEIGNVNVISDSDKTWRNTGRKEAVTGSERRKSSRGGRLFREALEERKGEHVHK